MTNHADKKCVFNNKLVTFRSFFYTVLLTKEWPFALLEWKKSSFEIRQSIIVACKIHRVKNGHGNNGIISFLCELHLKHD